MSMNMLMKQAHIQFIPQGWSLKKIGISCSIRNDLRKPLSTEERSIMQGEFPYYGPTGFLDSISEYLIDGQFATIGEDGDHFLKPKDKKQTLLLSGKFNVNNHAHLIESTNKCSAEWFAIYFQHRDITDFLSRQGANRYKLNKATLEAMPILLPPLPEQKAIADLLSVWDTAIEKTEKLIAAKEQRFRWLLDELINKPSKNGKWREVRLSQICNVVKGQQLNVEHMIENGQYYALNGGIAPSGRTEDYNTPEDTITISEGGNSCGFVSYNTEKFWAGGHCYSLLKVDRSIIESKYLYHFLKSNETKIMKLRVGSGLPNIQKKDIDTYAVVYPNLEVQKNISQLLDFGRKEISSLVTILNKYKTQKRGLMQKLLTGEWRVRY